MGLASGENSYKSASYLLPPLHSSLTASAATALGFLVRAQRQFRGLVRADMAI